MAGTLGVFRPKIKVISTSAELEFSYSVLKKFEPEHEEVQHTDKISGHRTYFTRGQGEHLVIEFLEHLFRYNNPDSKADDIQDFLYNEVEFYFDKNVAKPIDDSNGDAVPFFFTGWQRVFIEQSTWQDGVILMFRSTVPVDLVETFG